MESPLICNCADLLRYFDATDLETAKRTLYKQTSCGAWLKVEGDNVTLGCIIEGSDAEVKADALAFPFSVSDLEHTMAWVDDRADELWVEANAR
jgi:hypothetical protein